MIISFIVSGILHMGVGLEPHAMAVEHRSAVSAASVSTKGWMPSLYKGQYFQAGQGKFRRCVMVRESHINYRSTNHSSSASGAYQFLDKGWRDGLVWMMLKESKRMNDGLGPMILELRAYPINKWSRYFQDRAFFTALNIRGRWTGAHHWAATVPGTGCSIG